MAFKKTAQKKTKGNDGFELSKYISGKTQVYLALAIILVLFLIYFAPMYFGGKTFQSGDIVTSKSMETYLDKERDGYTLWNPYLFCGMPAYALATGFKWFNLAEVLMYGVVKLFGAFFAVEYANWTLRLIILAFTSFLLMYHFTKDSLLSLIVGFATGFSIHFMLFIYLGHVTKLASLCWFPLILLIIIRFRERIRLLDFGILIIVLQLFLQGWHVQIIFYCFLAIGIYYILILLQAMRKKNSAEYKQIFQSGGVFALSAVIALLIQVDNFTQIYEYTPYSTRGTKSITEEQTLPSGKGESDFYQYATNWSFSPGEVMTFIIPSYYGFGNSTYKGPLSNNVETEVNTYFGQMPFVDMPMYMGVLIFVLAIVSIFINWKNNYVKILSFIALFSIFVSFGRTFPIAYDLMYHYFPFFDKFRVPSMILVLAQICFPILAGFGIHKILSNKQAVIMKINNLVKYLFGFFGAILVLTLISQEALKTWFIDRIILSGQKGQQLQVLHGYMSEMFISDVFATGIILTLFFGLTFFYLKSKISKDILLFLTLLLVVFDLLRINYRGVKYIEETNVDNIFKVPWYVQTIKNQGDDEPFRIINIKQDGSVGSLNQNSNVHAYFLLEDIYGYSGIKPRAYQDIMDVVGGPINPTLWSMLNVKYIITEKPVAIPALELVDFRSNEYVYLNKSSLSRIYFTDTVITNKPISILNEIKNNNFNPSKLAYVEKENLIVTRPDSTAWVKIVKYLDEQIIVEANSSGNNFMFLGNTYYPVGWKAFINDVETEIIRSNHGFMGIVVPKGKYNIRITYAPESFFISKYIAFILSASAFLIIIIGFVKIRRDKNEPA